MKNNAGSDKGAVSARPARPGRSGLLRRRQRLYNLRTILDRSRVGQTRMQTSNRFFDDLAKMASGAASTVVGVRQEIEALVRQRIERLVADFDLVRRDEFEAVKAMAANARAEQERLERRLAELEAKLAGKAASAENPPSAGSAESE